MGNRTEQCWLVARSWSGGLRREEGQREWGGEQRKKGEGGESVPT